MSGENNPAKRLDVRLKISMALRGRTLTEEWRKKISKTWFKKGNIPWTKGRKGFRSGELCPFWKGGVSKANHLLRQSIEYKLWRKSVFERDKYTCIWCGYRGGEIEADHIKPFAYYPELRFDIDNGRTLCRECHKKTETYLQNRK